MNCPKCNELNNTGSNFCMKCGTKLDTSVINDNDNNQIINGNHKKKKIPILIVLIILIIVIIMTLIFLMNRKNNTNSNGSSRNKIVTIVEDENGIAKFIDGNVTNINIKDENDAYKALETLKNKLKFNNVKDEFTIESIETSEEITYYKFHQKYKNINVYGNNLVLSVDKNGKVLSMSGTYLPDINIDINSKLSEDNIKEIVKKDLGNNAEINSIEKSIYADSESQNLVYIVSGYSNSKVGEYFIDANSGKIYIISDTFNYAKAYEFTGEGINGLEDITIEEFYDLGALKTRYRLVDPTRNIVIAHGEGLGTDLFGIINSAIFSAVSPMVGDLSNGSFIYGVNNEKSKQVAKNGITTLKQYERIYDYYYNNLNRNSYDNKGGKIVVNIDVSEKTFGTKKLQNAAWLTLTNQMYIGYMNNIPYSISTDVLAHEFTHGVVSYTSKFASVPKNKDSNRAFETGALNEGYSDILGSLIEGKNWTINEDIETVRSLINPTVYKTAGVKGGQYYYPDGYINENRTLEQFLKDNDLKKVYDYDNGGVHDNATVPGHAAYLMHKNGAFKSLEEMAKIWYNSLFLLSSYSNFEDAALAVIKTAKNFGLSNNSIRIIEEAFMETKMLEDTRIEINGNVSDGKRSLANVNIKIKSLNDNEDYYDIITDKDGNFSQKIPSGTYEITFTKEGYQGYNETITMHGDTSIDIVLVKKDKQKDEKEEEKKDDKSSESLKLTCKSDNCHTLTIYFLENINNNSLDENYKSFSVEDGTVLDANELVKHVNDIFKMEVIKTDGETFTITMSDFSMNFGWYYKDTNERFNFNEPITKDVEIEMKLFDGAIDNDFLKNIYNIFNNGER